MNNWIPNNYQKKMMIVLLMISTHKTKVKNKFKTKISIF